MVDLNACREEAFKFFSQLYSPEDDKETEKYKKLLAELIRDSLALRSLQITSIAMSRYKKKLEIENYVSLSTYIEGTKRVKPPDDQLRYMCLYHCKRIADKLNQKKGLFNDLCIGMSTFSTLAIKYLLDSLFSQAQLWTAMSQLIPIMNKMEADMNKKESHRSMIETLWKIYLRIQTASLDKVIALNKHEPSKIDFNEYCQEIINKSEKRVERGERDLEKFKSKSEKKFDEIIKMMFELMVENLEMRKLLNVAHRRLLGVDDVRV